MDYQLQPLAQTSPTSPTLQEKKRHLRTQRAGPGCPQCPHKILEYCSWRLCSHSWPLWQHFTRSFSNTTPRQYCRIRLGWLHETFLPQYSQFVQLSLRVLNRTLHFLRMLTLDANSSLANTNSPRYQAPQNRVNFRMYTSSPFYCKSINFP